MVFRNIVMDKMYLFHVHFSGIVTCQRDIFPFVTQEHVSKLRFSDYTSGRDIDGFTRRGVSSIGAFLHVWNSVECLLVCGHGFGVLFSCFPWLMEPFWGV